ncbi:MAG: hypothetical protein AAF658_16255, partial [Myxococcota bacterium]
MHACVLIAFLAASPAAESLTEAELEPEGRRELDVDLRFELGALALSAASFGLQAWIGNQEDGRPVWDSASRFDRWTRDQFVAPNPSARSNALDLSDRLLYVTLPVGFLMVEVYDIAFDEGTYGGAFLDLYTVAI